MLWLNSSCSCSCSSHKIGCKIRGIHPGNKKLKCSVCLCVECARMICGCLRIVSSVCEKHNFVTLMRFRIRRAVLSERIKWFADKHYIKLLYIHSTFRFLVSLLSTCYAVMPYVFFMIRILVLSSRQWATQLFNPRGPLLWELSKVHCDAESDSRYRRPREVPACECE